uniref:RING-type domain-containing protein n=1 Tax=Hyaloperonospora arabidopsidis (strain Emoy2) TaxID=559515 RepID=M4BQJ1_HYAAE
MDTCTSTNPTNHNVVVTASFHPKTYESLSQAWIWPTKQQQHTQVQASPSSTDRQLASFKRRNGPPNALRKSSSDRPLTSPKRRQEVLATTGGSTNALNEVSICKKKTNRTHEDEAQRRERITARAEEILLEKRCVGMLVGATCPVCLTDDVDTQLSECGHVIHAKCIKRWIQSGTCCPVCREEVVDIEEAFTSPSVASMMMTKDRLMSSSEATYLPEDEDDDEDGADYEWGWFKDFDEGDDELNAASTSMLTNGSFAARRSLLTTFPGGTTSRQSLTTTTTPMLNRKMSSTFDMCRTFPPLHEVYDLPYHKSKYPWMRVLPSDRHIAVKIQIRSFRIVEVKTSKAQHAEYLIEMQLDGRYISRWCRYSAIYRFVWSLDQNQFRQSMAAWHPIDAKSRWFNRLELSYLHKRCRMLEAFAHKLLIESPNAHPLAGLIEC